MPAATEPDLFDYEGNIEDPLAVALLALLPTVQITTSRTTQADEEHKVTPRIELALLISSLPQHHSNDRAGTEYCDTRQGTVSFLCAARRDASDQSLGLICGTLRANLRKSKTLLNATNCPLYEIVWFEESGAQPAFEGQNDEIQRIITADITFQIKPESFPVGP